jgi:hypothetical protein
LFLYCDFSKVTWSKILSWLGVFGPLAYVVDDHALQF